MAWFSDDQTNNKKHYPITASATPDYDEWGMDSYWSSDDWLTWHRALVKEHGRNKANEIFVLAWKDQGFGSSPLDALTFDSAFIEYTKNMGLNSALWSGSPADIILKPATAVIQGTTKVTTKAVNTAVDVVEDVTDTVENTTKTMKWLVPALIVVGVLILGTVGYFYMKNATRMIPV